MVGAVLAKGSERDSKHVCPAQHAHAAIVGMAPGFLVSVAEGMFFDFAQL
jgi:hypothetical protein